MKLSIELPNTKTFAEIDQEYMREALVSTLYHIGKISGKEACITIGKSRREFEEILPKFGFSILSDSEDSVEVELKA